MTDIETIPLEHLRRLDIKPGDRFVLTHPGHLSFETAERVRAAWAKFTGGDAERFPLLLLPEGTTLAVIRAEET